MTVSNVFPSGISAIGSFNKNLVLKSFYREKLGNVIFFIFKVKGHNFGSDKNFLKAH